MKRRAVSDGRRDFAGESVVEDVDSSEITKEADGGGDLAANGVIVEAELAKGGELSYLLGDVAAEFPPWELDCDDFPPDALYPDPLA